MKIVAFERYWSDQTNQAKLLACQSIARTWMDRKEFNHVKELHRSSQFISQLSTIQAHIRGQNARKQLAEKEHKLKEQTDFFIEVQAISRGYLARHNYKSNVDKIVKVQTFIKNKLVTNAYRKLTTESNPSIRTVKSFIHLLDDSDLDFDRELALEDMRQQVIENIRENNQLDSHINSIDIQIALFLKNAISIDEVLKHSGAFKKKKEQQRIMSELAAKNNQLNPYSFSGIDRDSRRRLELYQQLVYVLQTEPKYLARLLSMTNRQDLGDFSSHKLIESTVLSLFGYATNAREEYLLINLCKV
jgi:Ras GTPase-activating-like protein IQGAP2/3